MKRFYTMLFVLLPFTLMAQIQFGYLSYDNILHEMPSYAQAMQDLQTLKSKYEAEALHGEEEFQRKFVDFLQGQKDFPQTIMQKRQAELQALMDNGVAFRLQVQELLAQAEKDMLDNVRKELNRAILEVGVEYGYGYILNTDDNSCPYINPVIGVDVTELVRQKLGLAVNPVVPQEGAPQVLTPDIPQPQVIQPVEPDVTTH